ncbi:hypothetical protein AVEN_185463-1 [Araneus ventricosus]|uniref:S1 motif domain-containing protein n=1 Tax=Araneus ventricosus TaxID=182803 RepID=A0A4Y2HDH5_ARAVE|nr:hypothetical protein AVEN_185463-1 [Araneus ventricosus]
MAEKKFSCIKQVTRTVQIPLPATFISNEISGIAEILESWKCQYSKQLQGVVVSYKHYSLSSSGFITPNKPFVYYNVKGTFDLFCPKVGDIVKGKIYKIFKEHIVCHIEDTINGSIHLSSDSSKELAPFICLNREILFEILSFSFDRNMVLSVKGKITRKCIQLMRELFPPQTFSNLVDTPELSNNTDEGIGSSNESADDGLLNHTFDGSKINDDDVNFKKPLSSYTKSKKKSSKRPKRDSESSSMDTSDVSTSDEKPKKKKKHNDKSNSDVGNYLNANNLSSDTVSCDTLIQNFSSFNHSEILEALKEEETTFEDNTRVKKHKKKQKRDLSPSLIGEPNNRTFSGDISSLDLNTSAGFETAKFSKKRKRESESSFMDTSEQSTADEMPKKKKKCKDKTVPLEEKEVKNELPDMPDDETITAALLSLKREISSPVKTSDNFVPGSKMKKKSKDKKSKEKDKSKKKKGKVLASGAVLKKDKKSQKKGSKKNKLDGEQSKKHKKSKSHKKDKSDKKKRKGSSKNKVSDVIKSEID